MGERVQGSFVAANDAVYGRETYIPDTDFRWNYELPGKIHIILTGDGDREEGWDWIYTDGADFDEPYSIIMWILSDLATLKQSFDDWVLYDRELIREKMHTIDQYIEALGGYYALSLDDLRLLIHCMQYIDHSSAGIEAVMGELQMLQ